MVKEADGLLHHDRHLTVKERRRNGQRKNKKKKRGQQKSRMEWDCEHVSLVHHDSRWTIRGEETNYSSPLRMHGSAGRKAICLDMNDLGRLMLV